MDDDEGEVRTTISIYDPTWKSLLVRKERGDSFDDVIRKLIEENERLQERVDELEQLLEDVEE